jgi:hypothetical protein
MGFIHSTSGNFGLGTMEIDRNKTNNMFSGVSELGGWPLFLWH